MGNQGSIQRHISEEFKRVKEATKKKNGKIHSADYLVLDQVLQMQPFREQPVDVAHLGTLFCLDENKDGRFSEAEFGKFAAQFSGKKSFSHDFQMHLQAFCTLHMWNEVTKEGGVEMFVEWFGKLLQENSMDWRQFRGTREIFLDGDTVRTLHRLLNIKLMYGYSFDNFFGLMQRVAEEKSLMQLENEKYDEYVPLAIVKFFGREFITGFSRVMSDMGFDHDMRIDLSAQDL